jgi:hypothetical protein
VPSSSSQLEEEARCIGGRWLPLLEPRDANTLTSIAHDKYSTERFYPWLVIDCQVAGHLNAQFSIYKDANSPCFFPIVFLLRLRHYELIHEKSN